MTNRKPVEWVSWFIDGRAEHFHADSPTGTRILVRLAELEGGCRRCAAPNCERPIGGRADRVYCSDGCTKDAARSRTKAAFRGRSRGQGTDLPDTPLARTNADPSPQVDRHADESVIAHTAHSSASPERRCANCGADIAKKRADAKVCSNGCRMAIARRASALAAGAELSDLLGQPTLFEESP